MIHQDGLNAKLKHNYRESIVNKRLSQQQEIGLLPRFEGRKKRLLKNKNAT